MPNCFQLIRLDTGEAATLQTVDAELCQHLELPFSDKHWTCGWYDDIGFSVACGATWDTLAQRYQEGAAKGDRFAEHDQIMLRCVNYLRQVYTTDAWVEIGRRN